MAKSNDNLPKGIWTRGVRVIETKSGSGVFTLEAGDDYTHETVKDIVAALIKAKATIDGWKVWADGAFSVDLPKGENVTHTVLAKLAKEADEVVLAYVRRPFPQPKLRFVKGGGAKPTRQTTSTRKTL